MKAEHLTVIGIGNEFRSDDAAGIITIRELRSKLPPWVRTVEHVGDGASLMELWKDLGRVIVIDATEPAGNPGMVRRLETEQAGADGLEQLCTSHSFGLAQALEMSKVLGLLPERMTIFGIEARYTGAGLMVSDEVKDSSEKVAEIITKEISELP